MESCDCAHCKICIRSMETLEICGDRLNFVAEEQTYLILSKRNETRLLHSKNGMEEKPRTDLRAKPIFEVLATRRRERDVVLFEPTGMNTQVMISDQ